MTNTEPSVSLADFEAVRQSLSGCGRCAGGILAEHNHEPVLDSEAAIEMAEDGRWNAEWGDDPAFQAWSFVGGLLAAAEDNLTALELLLAADVETVMPVFTVARSALECSARAFWIAEPGIGVRARIARGMNERIYGLEEVEKIPIKGAQDIAARRLPLILKGAKTHGFDLKRSRTRVWLSGEQRPAATAAVAKLLPSDKVALGEIAFRYQSAVAHGTAFGLWQQFESNASASDGTRRRAQLVKRPMTSMIVAGLALYGYLRSRSRHFQAYGYASESWNSWVRDTLTSVRRVVGS